MDQDQVDTPPEKRDSKFRARYRARIKPSYSPVIHATSVVIIGMVGIIYAALQIENLSFSELSVIPIMLFVANLGEYITHRYWGHVKRRIGGLFYMRHTVDHHSFFTNESMTIERWRDWRVVLFPTWLIVVLIVAIVLPLAMLLQWWFRTNVAALSAIVLLGSYLFYEFMHTCFHLPDEHVLANFPYIRWMSAHHAKHHEHAVMVDTNFNLTWPLCDLLFRTMSR